jgi:hypothetical protein
MPVKQQSLASAISQRTVKENSDVLIAHSMVLSAVKKAGNLQTCHGEMLQVKWRTKVALKH